MSLGSTLDLDNVQTPICNLEALSRNAEFPSSQIWKPSTLSLNSTYSRPGDIVLARVISFGDAAAGYLLTTGTLRRSITEQVN